MTFVDEGLGQLNTLQLNDEQINAYLNPAFPCAGVTLVQLRVRLRNELSGYGENTLISDDPTNDVERQFINDGIGLLWPHDWQTVSDSQLVQQGFTRFYLPDDCEHVLRVDTAKYDINNQTVNPHPIPHSDGWIFDSSFISASSNNLITGQPWLDEPKKTLVITDYSQLGSYPGQEIPPENTWIIVRYARRWPELKVESDCIGASANRIQAVIYYACAQYFSSQFQVNTESIRYRNYMDISKQFMQMYQLNLVKDSKPLYII